MIIQQKQLTDRSFQALKPIYLITGDEQLLVKEVKNNLYKAANKAGFSNKERMNVDNHFNWNQLTYATQSLSLFDDKTIIEIHHPKAKFDKKATQILEDYLTNPAPEKLILIICNKLTAAQKKANWFKLIDKAGVIIPIWPIAKYELDKWIQQRLKRFGLSADAQSIQLLAEFTEGNLSATDQAIEKLNLLYPKSNIQKPQMESVLCNNTQFTIFDLTNYALQRDPKRVTEVLASLRFDGIEPILILWAISRELRSLLKLAIQYQQGVPLPTLLSKEWATRKILLQKALPALSTRLLKALLLKCQQVDLMTKGAKTGNSWQLLESISLSLSGNHLFSAKKNHART